MRLSNLLCMAFQMSGFYHSQSIIPLKCPCGAMFSLLGKKDVYFLMGHCAIQLLQFNKRTNIINSLTTTALKGPLICFHFVLNVFMSFYVNTSS
jgi:hypothetical protein